MKRRLIALLLCIAMIGSMTVYAVGNEDVVCPTCGNTNCSVVHGDTSAILLELLTINNLSDLLIEMCKEENLPALMAMPAREILVLEEHASVLYEGLEEPTEQDTADLTDILDMIYQLPNAPEMVTYNTEAPRKDVEGLVTNKEIVGYDRTTGKGTLVLEAYATGQSITTTTTTSAPADIVLVLDQSTTMEYCMCGGIVGTNQCECDKPIRRIDALHDAVETFVNAVHDKADETINHRIALLGFATYEDSGYGGAGNTEIIYPEINIIKISTDDYKKALHDVSTETGWASIKAGLNKLTVRDVGGQTAAHAGFIMAKNVFGKADSAENRSKIVVFFTDGSPDDANAAIEQAKALKDKGITVYSVGTFSGEDLANENILKFMNYVSSNYPSAEGTNNPGDPAENPKYFMQVSSADDLEDIFQSISTDITTGGSDIELGEEAVLKDVISDQFEIDGDITVSTAPCTGKNGDTFTFDTSVGSGLTAAVNGNTVSVDGFNYSENWVGEEKKNDDVSYHGKKLILEIPIKAKDGFMGGNQVETNAPGSGVFDGDEVVEEFVSPKVDVDAKPLSIKNTEWNVYLKGGLTKEQLITGAEVQKAIDALDPWQKVYVTFETKIYDSNNAEVTDITNLTEDETYTVKVTTVPTGEGTAASEEATGKAEVNVFLPTITFKDSAVNAGETPDYDDDNFVSLVWKHDNVESTTVTMTGTKPTLDYGYEPYDVPISNETNVKVTVTMNKDNIHDYVTFYREACTGQDWSCGFTGGEVDANAEDRINFVVHVKTFDLIIQKQGADADLDAAFVFNISGEGIDMDVVIYGNGSVTIKDLPSGRYTISETAGYWRYDLAAAQTIDTSVTAPVGGKVTTTFINTLARDKWLDAIAHATNVFGSNS